MLCKCSGKVLIGLIDYGLKYTVIGDIKVYRKFRNVRQPKDKTTPKIQVNFHEFISYRRYKMTFKIRNSRGICGIVAYVFG